MSNRDKRKTITFSIDGTGNEPSDAGRFTEYESVSNVLKLHVLIGGGFEADRTATGTDGAEDQVAFHYWLLPLLDIRTYLSYIPVGEGQRICGARV